LFRDALQGRKGFAHEQTRSRLEVRPYGQEVALLQPLHWNVLQQALGETELESFVGPAEKAQLRW